MRAVRWDGPAACHNPKEPPVGDVIERGERDYRWRGARADPEAEADNGIEPGIADPPEDDLLDWRDIGAIGAEQARMYALWREGRVGNKAARTGMILLAKLMDTCERAANSRLAEIEDALVKVQAQVAMQDRAPAPARPSRFLT